MKQEQIFFVIQYPPLGTEIGCNAPRMVHPDDADQFVALDANSGGYPYPVALDKAQRYSTEKQAQELCDVVSYLKFTVKRVRSTLEII